MEKKELIEKAKAFALNEYEYARTHYSAREDILCARNRAFAVVNFTIGCTCEFEELNNWWDDILDKFNALLRINRR